jgi:Hypothetical protein (DUF2513)
MKRDMELIRELLMAIESEDSPDILQASLKLKVNSALEDTIYNLKLMIDAGLLVAEPIESQAGTSDIFIERLTWEGHEFLDSARNESIWKETMGLVQKKGGSVTIGILTQLLTSVAKQHFGLN